MLYIYGMDLTAMQKSKRNMKTMYLFELELSIKWCRIIKKYLFLKDFSMYHTRIALWDDDVIAKDVWIQQSE